MKQIFYLMALFLAFSVQGYAREYVESATWDWKDSSSPVYASGITNNTIEGTTGWLKSSASATTEVEPTAIDLSEEDKANFDDYQMYVDATSGKLYSRGTDAQFNQGTKLLVPVFNYGDKVSVLPYPGYTACKIGELNVADATTATTYTASLGDITNGYVVVEATGIGYLYSITVDYVEEAEAQTALWDFQNGNPTSITSVNIQNTTGYVESTATPGATLKTEAEKTKEEYFAEYYMYVDATSGKLERRSSGDAQFNNGTILQIPIKSPGDKITVVAYPGYYDLAVGGIDATGDKTEYIASVEDYNQGYVVIEGKNVTGKGGGYLYSIQWDAYDGTYSYNESNLETTGTPDAVWDWQKDNPAGILSTSVSNSTATVASTVEGISMFIDATNGGSVQQDNGKNQAVRSQGVVFYFPCSVGDQLTCYGYNSNGDTYSGYTVGNDAEEHYGTYVLEKIRAKDMVNVEELTDGTVKSGVEAIIDASGKEGAIAVTATKQDYFFGYVLTTYNPYQEKCIYSSTFDEWENADASTTANVVSKKTKYSNEEFTFTLFNTDVYNYNNNTSKFDWEYGYLMAAKNTGDANNDAYVEISEISSITSIHIYEGVTGGATERGWGVQAKGDGDSDWVTVFSEAAGGTYREEDIAINKTNCSLRFYNLKPSENAYLFQLDIYGEVDFSKVPSLDCFTVNGTTYYGDVFDEDADGNMVCTVELFSTEDMVSSSNQITEITGEGSCEVGTVIYAEETDACTVTIPVTLNEKTTNFIVYVVRKPWYTLTYYNSDGTALAGTQSVEKDTKIGEFIHSESDVTVAEGKKFRGWAEALKESYKYTTEDIVKSDLALYALVTNIEVESRTMRYVYNLQNDYFDPADHEAFNPSEDGYWHDASHGWAFKGGKIDILVGGNAFIIMSLCQYSNSSSSSTISLLDKDGVKVCEDIDSTPSTDGALGTFQYEGGAGKLTIQFGSGEIYLHKLTIANTADLEIDADGEYIVVPIVEGQSDVDRGNTLLSVIDVANAQSTENGRVFVFLPNGTYDLGEECLTQISRSNVSLIGQSEKNTTIVNEAPVEGIAVSATLLNTSTGLYMQDLTLKNAYDYYGLAGDGRADCFQDNGSHTICKNIRMLSYQDTYYSYNNNDHYFETSEIHGIVDYICGSGNVFFSECTLYNEGRGGDNVAGSSSQYCYITAPNTNSSCQFGYVFDNCTVTGTAGQTYCYGRAWNNSPRCVWINTTLADPSCIISERWRLDGMNNCVPDVFAEYGTVDASGNDAMPTTTVQSFYGEEKTIVLTADEAKEYSYETFSTATQWDPMAEAEQIELSDLTFTGNVVSWTGNADAKCYGIFVNGIFQDFTKDTSYTLAEGTDTEKDHICVRAANQNGGLGPNLENFVDVETESIAQVSNDGAELVATVYYDLSGRKLTAPQRGINIAIEYYSDGTQKTTKVLTK